VALFYVSGTLYVAALSENPALILIANGGTGDFIKAIVPQDGGGSLIYPWEGKLLAGRDGVLAIELATTGQYVGFIKFDSSLGVTMQGQDFALGSVKDISIDRNSSMSYLSIAFRMSN